MECFASLRLALHLALVSKPIVSSRMYKILSALSKRRSGPKVSPVLKLGDGNNGRSTNRVAPLIYCNEDATKFITELWCEVYRPSSRYTLHPAATCSNDSGSKQKVRSDVCESFHNRKFLRVESIGVGEGVAGGLQPPPS